MKPAKSSFARRQPVTSTQNKSEAKEITKFIPGKVLKGVRVVIEAPADTELWSENPRNFDYDKDLSDLVPLIIKAGSNSTPVDARVLPNGKIQIIAGSRRRASCIAAKKPLVADVWSDLTDDDAATISETENEGRKDITELGKCLYFAAKQERLKASSPNFDMDEFAKNHHMKKSMMYERISIAKLPETVRKIAETDTPWTLNDLIKLRSIYRDHVQSSAHSEIEFCEVGYSAAEQGLGPKDILRLLASAGVSESDKAQRNATESEEITVGAGTVVCKESRTGATSIHLNRGVPRELKEQILNLIKSYQ